MKLIIPIIALLAAAARAEVITLVHTSEPFPKNTTVMWSPLFQATWDKLNEHLGPPNKEGQSSPMMMQLDTFKWNVGKIMPEGSWKTWTGPATSEFLNEVNAEAAALINDPHGPFQLPQKDPNGIAAFGLLDRNVSFQKEFFRSRKVSLAFHTNDAKTPVCFFGTRDKMSEMLADCVRVLSYRPKVHSYAIQILCKESDDTVILYLPEKPQDFSTACSWLRAWRSHDTDSQPSEKCGPWGDPKLHTGDDVRIPYLNLEARANLLPKLAGNRNHGGVPLTLIHAEQFTRFQLHEKGARVRVEASLSAFGDSNCFAPRPRRFVFDRPFFVFLWRDGAEWPYFGAWIGDDSALQKFE
jgi:hypothetical protein